MIVNNGMRPSTVHELHRTPYRLYDAVRTTCHHLTRWAFGKPAWPKRAHTGSLQNFWNSHEVEAFTSFLSRKDSWILTENFWCHRASWCACVTTSNFAFKKHTLPNYYLPNWHFCATIETMIETTIDSGDSVSAHISVQSSTSNSLHLEFSKHVDLIGPAFKSFLKYRSPFGRGVLTCEKSVRELLFLENSSKKSILAVLSKNSRS